MAAVWAKSLRNGNNPRYPYETQFIHVGLLSVLINRLSNSSMEKTSDQAAALYNICGINETADLINIAGVYL
jgi:hypothetical protein